MRFHRNTEALGPVAEEKKESSGFGDTTDPDVPDRNIYSSETNALSNLQSVILGDPNQRNREPEEGGFS
jgi:hypothetical protein